jgi:hypothetical protein
MVKTGLKAYRQSGMSVPAVNYLSTVLFIIICSGILTEFIQAAPTYSTHIQRNPSDKQLLLNGRIWRNQYSKASGDQFFLTNTFLKGSVTFNGQRFNDLDLMYDICNDELILRIDSYPVISMNKEMVDSFGLVFENRNYNIINAGTDTTNILRGYVNVLYNGPSKLYVKYIKKLQPLAVDGRYDLFYQENHIYVKRGNEIVDVSGKRRLLNLIEDKKKEIRYYMKNERLKISRKDPNTFIPVLKYYDSLQVK